MTFVYTLEDIIGLIALGVGVVGLLLIIIVAHVSGKITKWRKKREEHIEKKLQEKYDKIEIEDEKIDGLYKAKGFETVVFNEAGLKKLEPVSDALQHGYEEGHQDGLNDAWELAKKIVMPTRTQPDAVTCEDLNSIFGAKCYEPVMSKFSASEAFAKVQEYEEKKKADAEIKVGDEIEISGASSDVLKMVVTQIDNQYISTVDAKGDTRCICKNTNTCVKTGRHFPQVEEMLKQMKGE